MKVALAGQGAFGIKHLEAMANIPGIEVVSLAGGNPAGTEEVAKKWNIPHWTTDLTESLKQPGVEAVILTTPTQLHAAQAIESMRAGKHVMVEIPMADTLEDSERIVATQKETGLVAMAGHTRRFNPSHQWVHKKIEAGELKVLQMDVPDLLLQAHQYERRRQAQKLDGSSVVAPLLPYRGSVRRIRPAKRPRWRTRCKVRCIRSWASPWTWAFS